MKKIISLCLFLLSVSNLYAQDQPAPILFPVVDGNVMYEKVVDVAGKDQGTIYLKAFEWIIDNFSDRKK